AVEIGQRIDLTGGGGVGEDDAGAAGAHRTGEDVEAARQALRAHLVPELAPLLVPARQRLPRSYGDGEHLLRGQSLAPAGGGRGRAAVDVRQRAAGAGDADELAHGRARAALDGEQQRADLWVLVVRAGRDVLGGLLGVGLPGWRVFALWRRWPLQRRAEE